MLNKVGFFIPLAIVITSFCGLVFEAVQQNYRQGAYDPQIQIAEDIANRQAVSSLITRPVEIDKSLSPFVIIYNEQGQVATSSAILDGQTPQLPSGVLDYVKNHGEDRLSWQPKPGVRIATIITKTNSGYVLAGRNMREVEKRIHRLFQQVVFIWFITLVSTFISTLIFIKKK